MEDKAGAELENKGGVGRLERSNEDRITSG